MTENTAKKSLIFTPIFPNLEELESTQVPFHEALDIKEYRWIRSFLLNYGASQATFDAYRSEIEKFTQWCLIIKKKQPSTSQTEDIKNYVQFLKALPAEWIQTKRHKKFTYSSESGKLIPNNQWRPFVAPTSGKRAQFKLSNQHSGYALSNSSIAASLRALSSLCEYLVEEDCIDRNPVKRLRQKNQYIGTGQAPNQRQVRRLSELQWSFALSTAKKAADEADAKHALEKERNLFILSALYGMYLRISELAESPRWQPQMNHFWQDADRNCWFKTVGKGNKERDITVSDSMREALKRYRTALGLPPFPTKLENTPLIPSLKHGHRHGIKSTRHIRRLVQDIFDTTHETMVKDGLTEEADAFKIATVHWLRHTGISDDVKVRPREHVREDAGHASSMTTDRYIDVERRERHSSGKNKKLDQLTE